MCASVSGLVALLSVPPFLQMVGFLPGWAGPLAALRSFNGYGLFANMTTQRPEIIIEGSDEGVLWLEYEFPWKPGDLRARPRLVAPHQPRLDWQLWFAALGGPGRNRWFGVLLQRLLEGQPEVLGLLETNPFPKHPPRYIRALLYQYHFTRAGEGGAWWRRELQGTYWPASSLGPPGPPPPPAPQMKACTAPPRRDVSSNKTALTRVYSHESSMP